MLITWNEIILAVHRQTSQLSVAVGCHFLSVYACAHIVSFPNNPLLGMRLAPTFELGCYDAKIKLVGACIKVLEWATVADFGCCQAEFMQSFTVSYACSVELLGGRGGGSFYE